MDIFRECMHRNAVWVVFLGVLFAANLWFGVRAAHGIYHYLHLSASVPIHAVKWEIEKQKVDNYAVIANYSFFYRGAQYENNTQVGGIFLNPWAAKEQQNKFSKKNWDVWFHPEKPQYSVLEKKFPLKKVFSAGLLFLLSVYFFCLGFYVGEKHGHRLESN